jgi:hypothetical protein
MSCSAIGKPKKPRALAWACSNPLSGTCKTEPILSKTEPISNADRYGNDRRCPARPTLALFPPARIYFEVAASYGPPTGSCMSAG